MSNPSKAKGTRFETAVCDYLRWALDDRMIKNKTIESEEMGRYAGLKIGEAGRLE